MRWLLIVLLAINIIYLGREIDREARLQIADQARLPSLPATADRLKLLEEMDEKPAIRGPYRDDNGDGGGRDTGIELSVPDDLLSDLPDIIPATPARQAGTATGSCYRYGPLPDENSLAELEAWFESRRSATQVRFTEEPGIRMFWIYLAPRESRELALEVLEEMKSRGIEDYRLINRGNLENAISLGLFSSRQAVDARLQILEEKGYIPVVVPYTNVKRVYWLDIQASSMAASEVQEGIPAKYTVQAVNCPDVF